MRRTIREGTVKLTGVMTVRRGGRVFRYFRRKGQPLVRLPDAPMDSAEFLAAYLAARGPEAPKTRPAELRAVIVRCLASPAMLAVSAAYRQVTRRELQAIAGAAGDALAADLRKRHIQADIAALSPHQARHRLKAWRWLCRFAVEVGAMTDDPSAGVRRKALPRTDGHAPWTPAEIEAFRARWPIGTAARAAMELLYWTGARTVDGVTIGPGMVDRAGVLVFRQSKTGDAAYVPWTCALPAYAAGMAPDRAMLHAALAPFAGHMTFLPANGRRRSIKGIGNTISRAAVAASIGKTAHGLRKARAIALAEAGATTHQIAAWTGHKTLAEVARYTSAMDRRAAVMGTEQDGNGANGAAESANREKSA